MSLLSDTPAERRFVGTRMLLCALAGMVTSAWCLYIDDVVNFDAVEYIRAAEKFASRDWAGAFTVHQWPFFAFLMWLVAAAFGLSFEHAGDLLNTVFFTASSMLFVLVVRAFGGISRRLTVFAALVAVLHPAFNEYRAFIIRDAGYLAFYLAALFCLARSVGESGFRYPLGVLAALVLASLFRIEGAVFLFSAPLLIATARSSGAGSPWMRVVLLVSSAAVLAVVLGWWLIAPNGGVPADTAVSTPLDVVGSAWHQITSSVSHKITVLRTEFLGPYAEEYAWALFIFAVVMILVSATLSQLTIPWALLVMGALGFGVRFPEKARNRIWLSLVGMHLAILLVFVVIKLFLASRYPLALTVTILILAPMALERLTARFKWADLKLPARVLVGFLLLWGAGECVSGLDNVTRARAVKDAGLWLGSQATVAGSLVTNDRRLAYYAGRHRDLRFIEIRFKRLRVGLTKWNWWPEASYFAVRLTRDQEAIEQMFTEVLGRSPERIFVREVGDRVLVYNLKH